ncbi:MAG: ankyrin repeat domain-containing protein [Bdellovibrionales bacterium]|nr:ankyrin repeat domain-containing protein [Bdellovibrionales bacterium]
MTALVNLLRFHRLTLITLYIATLSNLLISTEGLAGWQLVLLGMKFVAVIYFCSKITNYVSNKRALFGLSELQLMPESRQRLVLGVTTYNLIVGLPLSIELSAWLAPETSRSFTIAASLFAFVFLSLATFLHEINTRKASKKALSTIRQLAIGIVSALTLPIIGLAIFFFIGILTEIEIENQILSNLSPWLAGLSLTFVMAIIVAKEWSSKRTKSWAHSTTYVQLAVAATILIFVDLAAVSIMKKSLIPETFRDNALSAAIVRQEHETIAKLSQDIQYDKQGKLGTTPLIAAARSGDLELFNKLINTGFKDFGAPKNGADAFFYSMKSENTDISKRLIALGKFDPEATLEKSGMSYLHVAAKKCRPFHTQLLIEKSVEIDKQDRSGNSALHLAVRAKCYNVVQQLLTKGADPSLKNNDDETIYELGQEDLQLRFLLEANIGESNKDKS